MKNAKVKPVVNAPVAPAVKKGQKAKTAAPVRAIIPAGYSGCEAAISAVKAGAKPSAYYPQGNVELKVLALPAKSSKRDQHNHAAILKALDGSTTGNLVIALDNGATRRNVRQLARSGLLVWKANK